MPYDYYEYLKKINENEKYTEIVDIVRENIWNETFEFQLSKEWSMIEDIILLILYIYLRYN